MGDPIASSVSPQPVKNVLFVCIGNSCRSQMAEAFANHLGRGALRAWSAGSVPFGRIAPEACAVMKEEGLSLDGQYSKGLADVPICSMDFIVSMGCGVVCPSPPGFAGRRVEWSIPDTYGGSLEDYRRARDLIKREVSLLFSRIEASEAR